VQKLAIKTKNQSMVGSAKLNGVLGEHVKHGLQVEGGAADHF
jgi:hypothetical protein